MFESDDFDQVLSQLDFPELPIKEAEKIIENVPTQILSPLTTTTNKLPESDQTNKYNTLHQFNKNIELHKPLNEEHASNDNRMSPKHSKRKIINTYFDHKSKRKFPGPAGLLTGTLHENKDEPICHLELLSQDVEFSQNNLRGELFDSPLWIRLLEDVSSWSLNNRDTIKGIKEQALAGNLRRRKAEIVTAFIETIDRSGTDPLIILRDPTGHIKCTLHRDAWSHFSMYFVSKYCAVMLWKPTVLTTGAAFKKHYLNITLRNIFAIYSSTVVEEEDKCIPEGYIVVSEDGFTVIKTESTPKDLGTCLSTTSVNNGMIENNAVIEDLDSMFSDDLF